MSCILSQHAVKFARPSNPRQEVRISYVQCVPHEGTQVKGTLLLIHGFPLTSHQFHRVFDLFAAEGFMVIAPDYTGAGKSSKPEHGYTKHAIAADLRELVQGHLEIKDKIHVVSHDIGCMIGHAYASQFPEDVGTITLGECPLPGTTQYEQDAGDVGHFHVNLHAHTDLAVSLISGREELYLRYFFEKQAYNTAAITDQDIDIFVKAYSQPGALRAAFLTYADFKIDKTDNLRLLKDKGPCPVTALAMGGARSHHAGRAESMVKQLYRRVEAKDVEESGHYIALENPSAFVRTIVDFISRQIY